MSFDLLPMSLVIVVDVVVVGIGVVVVVAKIEDFKRSEMR